MEPSTSSHVDLVNTYVSLTVSTGKVPLSLQKLRLFILLQCYFLSVDSFNSLLRVIFDVEQRYQQAHQNFRCEFQDIHK